MIQPSSLTRTESEELRTLAKKLIASRLTSMLQVDIHRMAELVLRMCEFDEPMCDGGGVIRIVGSEPTVDAGGFTASVIAGAVECPGCPACYQEDAD